MRVDAAILVGLGGTGSALAEPLARLLTYHPSSSGSRLLLVDGDSYDDSNIARQIGARPGENKAEVWSERLDAPNTHAFPIYADGDAIRDLASEFGAVVVILAVDNFKTRASVIASFSEEPPLNYLILFPGNERTQGNLIAWRPGVDPSPADRHPEFRDVKDEIPRVGGCHAAAVHEPQTIGANFMAAALTLAAVQNWLDDKGVPPELLFDVERMRVTRG